MLIKQFISNKTLLYLVSILIVHVLAWITLDTVFSLPILVLIGIAVLVVSVKDLKIGLIIALLEIFTGGQGHLIDANLLGFSISIRMVIFGAVMLAWLILFIKKDISIKFVAMRDIPWLILIIAVLIGGIVGFITNQPSIVYDDINGFLTIGYVLPFISIKWTQKSRRELLIVLFSASAWLVFLTLFLSYLFTHLDGKMLHEIYIFVRDTRLAEITLQTVSDTSGNAQNILYERLLGSEGYFYRVFMQSQFYAVIMSLIMTAGALFAWRDQRLPDLIVISLIGLSSTLLLSMSRSFILGAGIAVVFLIFFAFFFGKHSLRNVLKRLVTFFIIGMFSVVTIWLTIKIPIPKTPDISNAAFYSTSANSNRDMAVSSRWALLGPMMDKIYQSPILGSGFGEEVTFVTDDPRVRETIPSGEWTTYRFEWGWQDIWLKMGMIGLIAFSTYAGIMIIVFRDNIKSKGYKWILFGFSAGLIMLFVSHIFSPYLNHPIGLMMMILVIPFLDFEKIIKLELISKERFQTLKLKKPQQKVAVNRK